MTVFVAPSWSAAFFKSTIYKFVNSIEIEAYVANKQTPEQCLSPVVPTVITSLRLHTLDNLWLGSGHFRTLSLH